MKAKRMYGIMLLAGCLLTACGGVKERPKMTVAQRITEVLMEDRTTLRVSFRRYLDPALETADRWRITEGITVQGVSNVPAHGKRSGTYLVRFTPALLPGRQYTLQVGELEPFVLTPDPTRYFAFPGGRLRALVMSYDDGNVQDRRLVGLFNKHGIKGSFHLNSAKLGQPHYLDRAEIKTLYRGHEVSGHSLHHPHLTHLGEEGVRHEVGDDRADLEKLTGVAVPGFSYPFGTHDARVIGILRSLGIRYARTVANQGRLDFLPADPLAWHPTCHQTGAMKAGRELLAWDKPVMALLYVWGHAWEFDRGQTGNDWQYIGDFCAMIGGKKEIWYATALEVADYLAALRALQFDYVGRTVKNPSRIDVWMQREDGKGTFPIPAKKTVAF